MTFNYVLHMKILQFLGLKSTVYNQEWIINSDLPCCAFARVIEQCCFSSNPNPFNGQTANFISKQSKVIESRTNVKKPIWSAIETTLCSITLTTTQRGKSDLDA